MRFVTVALLWLWTLPAFACDLARPIVFAGFDWDSAQFHTAVARLILEKGYGCKTDAVVGSTIPLVQALAQGDVDVAMEIWKDNVTEVWTRAVARGQVLELGINFPDAVQGWYVPRALVAPGAAAAGLRSVSDLPRFKALFRDPEEPAKGRFYNCPAGWNCEVINTAKLRAYGLDRDFANFRPGTGAALAAAIAGAMLKREPILAYYWGPTWVLGKYDLVALEEPPWNETDWRRLAADPAYPRAVAYPTVAVAIGANARFAAAAPETAAFLRAYRTDAALINEALAAMQDSRGDAARAARTFLRRHGDIWHAWVAPAVAARVDAAIGGD
jgi:ABC-type proline/glycine betaine transport system substrate-binding protein